MKLSIIALSVFSLSRPALARRRLKSSKASKSSSSSSSSSEDIVLTPVPPPVPEPTPPPPPPPVFKSAAPLYNQYDVCTDFCKGAITQCEGVVDWVTETYATPYSRHFRNGAGNSATGKPSEQFGACHDRCMGWMYWRQEPIFDNSNRFAIGQFAGDSLNCRMNHLQLGSIGGQGLKASESDFGQHHCMHLTNDGGTICTDKFINGVTPPQRLKNAMFTRHRLGDCWLSDDDKLADCHYKALNDDNVDQNLLWLPDDIEYIFLVANALTKIPNLSRFTELKGIYFTNNAISVLEPDDFASNTKLEIIGFAGNFITELPAGLLTPLVDLKFFVLSNNYVSAVPQTLFATTKDIEAIVLSFNRISSFEPGTFDGLTKLEVLVWADQGKAAERGTLFSENGIPDGLFDDLVNLKFMSFFFNNFSVIKDSWFGDWSAKLEHLSFFSQTPALVIEDGVFEKLPSLIELPSQSSGNIIDPTDLTNNPVVKTVLYGDSTAIFVPLPEPALYNAALL